MEEIASPFTKKKNPNYFSYIFLFRSQNKFDSNMLEIDDENQTANAVIDKHT